MTVRKTGDTNILTLAFVSTDGSMDKQDIADYVASNIQDPLSRVNGVGDIDAYGSQYSMRIWLDPAKLNSYQLTTKDVTDAISSQNAQIAVGQLGGTPSVDKQALNATINLAISATNPGAVPQYHPARQSGWFRGDAGRCRHRRDGGGEVRLPQPLQPAGRFGPGN